MSALANVPSAAATVFCAVATACCSAETCSRAAVHALSSVGVEGVVVGVVVVVVVVEEPVVEGLVGEEPVGEDPVPEPPVAATRGARARGPRARGPRHPAGGLRLCEVCRLLLLIGRRGGLVGDQGGLVLRYLTRTAPSATGLATGRAVVGVVVGVVVVVVVLAVSLSSSSVSCASSDETVDSADDTASASDVVSSVPSASPAVTCSPTVARDRGHLAGDLERGRRVVHRLDRTDDILAFGDRGARHLGHSVARVPRVADGPRRGAASHQDGNDHDRPDDERSAPGLLSAVGPRRLVRHLTPHPRHRRRSRRGLLRSRRRSPTYRSSLRWR